MPDNCAECRRGIASAVAAETRAFKHFSFFPKQIFCNGRGNIRESGNQIIFLLLPSNHLKTDSEVVLLRNLLATHK